jgi:hypothetical protein
MEKSLDLPCLAALDASNRVLCDDLSRLMPITINSGALAQVERINNDVVSEFFHASAIECEIGIDRAIGRVGDALGLEGEGADDSEGAA